MWSVLLYTIGATALNELTNLLQQSNNPSIIQSRIDNIVGAIKRKAPDRINDALNELSAISAQYHSPFASEVIQKYKTAKKKKIEEARDLVSEADKMLDKATSVANTAAFDTTLIGKNRRKANNQAINLADEAKRIYDQANSILGGQNNAK